ncbi:MAG: phosphatase PAP2 family protein [Lachnospiraceae bacterium]|nr:phosphatase PAP2 family protein [Lachnospiraceae bacterium]
MEQTFIADWLNSVFAQYDYKILEALHQMAVSFQGILTPFFLLVSSFGTNGIGEILLGVVLLLFKKTRKTGVCVLVSLVMGLLITNVVVKNLVARPRPFADVTSIYYEWWRFVGGVWEGEYSFPSGHTTAIMAAITAVVINTKGKYRWLLFIFVILMGMSRNYLMVHYPSDILGGILAGSSAAMIACFIVNKSWKKMPCL